MSQRIGFIGVGQMGSALMRGWIKSELVEPEQLWAFDINAQKAAALHEELKINVASTLEELLEHAEVILIAVKPQNIPELLPGLKGKIDSQLLISICAGVPTRVLESVGEQVRVIRTMPNTPAQISRGFTGIAGGKLARPEELELAQTLFSAVGRCAIMPEQLLDAITALGGSGPAFFFYFMECLITAANKQGIAQHDAEQIVKQVARGAVELARRTPQSLEELRRAVTSKGGTTEAGLKVLESANFEELIERVIEQATTRAHQLSERLLRTLE